MKNGKINKGVQRMSEIIKKISDLLDKATDEQLRKIYIFIKAYLDG